MIGGEPLNPTSAKTGQIWGTRQLLRVEISLPAAIRLFVYPGVWERCGLERKRHAERVPVLKKVGLRP